jgi:protocatechuate 3,4-dioxygenase beta subunit
MWRKVFPLFAVCVVCVFSAAAQTVLENESQIAFAEKTADVLLTVENSGPNFNGSIELELLDTKDVVRSKISSPQGIKNGKETYKISMPLGDLMQKNEDDIAWFRLRYRVGNAAGTIALSQIVREIFELRVIATENLLTGMTYRSRIRATNPFTNLPVEGVKITAELNLDLRGDAEQKLKLAANAATDADGFAVVDFQIPLEANLRDDGEIKITGRKGGIVREAIDDINTQSNDFQFLMLTDKPIYQPEQTLSVRGILMKGGEGKTVVAGSEVEFRIEDEDNTVLYREKVKTSDFGVAAIVWNIPESAKLGNYRIRVKNQDQDEGYYVGNTNVKITRYDLPNFVVNAKALKPFYLPDEKEADIEVRADYLFGKPVTKGKARVVRETDRTWNYKTQKYDIEEGESHDGSIDDEGKLTVKFDLSKEQEELRKDRYGKFRDLKFTAYVTDLTTNKTEQRRFDARITKEAIHVYFIGGYEDRHPNLPVKGYVSTFYADGSPAVCDVEIKGREDGTNEKFKTLQKLKTNSFGAGKVEFKRPKFEDEKEDLEIRIAAKDLKDAKGTFGNEDREQDIEFDGDDVLQIEIAKAIYKPGEAIKIDLASNRQTGLVYIDVVKGWSVIDSYFANLNGGKAELKIPYQPNFKGELKVAAFFEDKDGDLVKTTRGVIFPAPQNLKVEANFDKESYKPNEEAKVSFGVTDVIGNAIESALGIVIFDRAIEERARTESDFNGAFSDFRDWLGYGDSFGGVNVKNLNDLDLSKPIDDELQLVAEVMFFDNYYYPNIFHSRTYETDAKSVYADYFKKQFEPMEKLLQKHYLEHNYTHPTDDASLRRILNENRFDFDRLRDPWGQNFRVVFETEKTQDIVRFFSAGVDKKLGTKDDFAVWSASFTYFTPTGNAINKAVNDYHARTGGYIRDEKTLLAELGVSVLNDRFGRPYHFDFEVSGAHYLIRIRSLGKDGIYSQYYWYDDFDVWTNSINYFLETEAKILKVLESAKSFPSNEAEFMSVLAKSDLDFDKFRDGYGEKVYLVKSKYSRYADKTETEKVRKFGEQNQTERTTVTPVTQEVVTFSIRGKGADRRENTTDDFTFAQFLKVISEQTKDGKKINTTISSLSNYAEGTGSIDGTITDQNGAVVPGATIEIKSTGTAAVYNKTTTSNDEGYFAFTNIPVGTYQITVAMSGFKSVQGDITVLLYKNSNFSLTLEAGQPSMTVNVTTDSSATIDSGDTKIDTNITKQIFDDLPSGTTFSSLLKIAPNVRPEALSGGFQAEYGGATGGVIVIDGKKFLKTPEGKLVPWSESSTPRLREYFPETLAWNPELITDANGKATFNFKMADNITTWKLYTIASTKNGRIGVVEKEITAFQPFFVDLEPPKFLTDGDEIFLPTQVRNYTPAKQKVDVTMTKSVWFSFLDAEARTTSASQTDQVHKIEVNSGDAKNAVFGFKATASVKDGKQKVTAIAEKDSDAIEKPVTVRPNGLEIVRTESKLFRASADFEINFPANALPKTAKAEVKIYPNLMAHVTESVEGLLQRPYGCGEQTISSTYPNLMILKFLKNDNFLAKKAKIYLQKGYERLLGYQVADGGFSYWGGKSESDVALTAYALRFLSDAKSQIAIDEKVIENAQNYLLKQQRADGSWTKKYYYETTEDARRTKLFTSYVARTLAMLEKDARSSRPVQAETLAFQSLQKALTYLKTRNAEIDEPYTLALFGLASLDAGNLEAARETAQRLEKMAIAEGDAVYWNLETNTPFYGWGTAGRIETTALVLQFLIKLGKEQETSDTSLLSKATMFLLKKKDRYGVWYSTQTTINVLDAFLAALVESKEQTISVSLNGEKLNVFSVSAEQVEPVILDLTDKLASANRLEVTSSNGSAIMSQIVAAHYIDWQDAEISNRDVNQSRQLRLDYKCDKQNAKIMEEVTCAVEAERIGFKGYGMLLAEIGLPPGADVSRESLEKAFEADWSLSRYDILPDRIILYMWSKAGGTKFNFKFKPRYGINAQTPASFVYDYYNEEAKATLAPMRFEVK